MKSKIVFHDLKMEILDDATTVARYYGELMYVIYEAPWCWLHFVDKTQYRVEVTLQYMMDNLPPAFVQCNRSVLLNLCYYREVDYILLMVRMDDGKEFNLARRRMKAFKETKNNLRRISPPCPSCYVCTHKECESRVTFCKR